MPRAARGLTGLAIAAAALCAWWLLLAKPLFAHLRSSPPKTAQAAPIGRQLLHGGRSARPQGPALRARPAGHGHPARHGRSAVGLTSQLRDAARIATTVAEATVAALAGAALLALLSRALWRPRRRMARRWIIPYRSDDASHEQLQRMFEVWHQLLLRRWWQRLLVGQWGLALEVRSEPDGQGGFECKLCAIWPSELDAAMEGALVSCYPDARVAGRESEHPEERAAIIRLKKRHQFVRPLRPKLEEGDNHVLVDKLLTQMQRIHAPACVQISLTPTPALFDRWSRARYQAYERSRSGRYRATARERSEVLAAELRAGLMLQNRPLFFADIRVGAPNAELARSLAGMLRGETAGENRLVERRLHAFGRLTLYRSRVRRGLNNPIPSWRRGVYSSVELAGMWHLPSTGLTVAAIRRSLVPRAFAPPEITRDPALALMRDEKGPVGIRPEDRSDGLGLIGGQKTGKTSVLCQSVRVDASDPQRALIVLMPKPGDARIALSMVPRERTTHFLDFENPQFGINPLLGDGDASMIADKVVSAFRDVHMEGDIRGSSDRYLRQAAQATIAASRAGALSEPPNLWHMYRLLLPSEVAFREHVVDAIFADPRFVDTATFFGRDLPNDLRDSLATTTAKLDAPRNKILRLLVDSLDKVLRHPVQLSIDELIRRREVLIVDGKMGTFGSDNCRVMMQFILSMVYSALQRQQQLPEEQRTRVALKIDEAHLVVNESFADALATLRSAGLEVVAAWQYGDQIEDPKLRSGMMSLLRQRCMFSMGEPQDARDMSSLVMSAYSDMIRDEPSHRQRQRLVPDVVFNLPNHRAICSWISQGARRQAFIGSTIPLQADGSVIDHHLAAQAARGCYVPEALPNPLPPIGESAPDLADADTAVGLETEDDVNAEQAGAAVWLSDVEPEPGLEPEPRPEPRRPDAVQAPPDGERPPDAGLGHRETAPAQASPARDQLGSPRPAGVLDQTRAHTGPRIGAPDSLVELDLGEVTDGDWEEALSEPAGRAPDSRQATLLRALWHYGHLGFPQIKRRYWSSAGIQECMAALDEMLRFGWLRRARLTDASGEPKLDLYTLGEAGLEVAKTVQVRSGPLIDPEARWDPEQRLDLMVALRNVRVNAWVMALQAHVPGVVREWRGPADSRLTPPGRKRGNVTTALRPAELDLGSDRRLRDVALPRLAPVSPVATLTVSLPRQADRNIWTELLVELDLSRGAPFNDERMRRYDAFLAGWATMMPRYRKLGSTPTVIFVCQDERQLLRYMRTADQHLTARVAQAGVPESEWRCPARARVLFVLEGDIHMGRLDALGLPPLPPKLRGDAKLKPRRVMLLPRSALAPRPTSMAKVPVG